jgi:hypothetical protein
VAALLPVGLGLAGGQMVGCVWDGEQGADGLLGIGVDPGDVALERGSEERGDGPGSIPLPHSLEEGRRRSGAPAPGGITCPS